MPNRHPRNGSWGALRGPLLLALAWFFAWGVGAAHADVVLDGSMGPSGAVPKVDDSYDITDDLGRYSSGNKSLHHSFLRFGIAKGETATFSATRSPDRIIARVTGGERTDIYGTLRSTVPDADLYLLNPSGVLFFKDSQLDVQGSFYTSTADELHFADGTRLALGSATVPPVLTAADPVAFGFLDAPPGEDPVRIAFDSSPRLTVPPGESLTAVARKIELKDVSSGGNKVIVSPGSTVQLAAAGSNVAVPLDLENFDPSEYDESQLGDVAFDLFAKVDVSGAGDIPAGRVIIRAEELRLTRAQITANHGSTDIDAAGSIDIAVRDDVRLNNISRVTTSSVANSRGGDIQIRAGGSVFVSGTSAINTITSRPVDATTAPTSGDVRIEAHELRIENGGQILTRALNNSVPGSVLVDVDKVSVVDDGKIVSSSIDSTGGEIAIRAGKLRVKDNGQILSLAEGQGIGGPIEIEASDLRVRNTDAVSLGDLTLIGSETAAASSARGGDVTVAAESIELLDGGVIRAVTQGSGHAGDLTLRDVDSLYIRGVGPDGAASGAFTQASAGSSGDAGFLRIRTRVLDVIDGSAISSTSIGAGNAGDIEIGTSSNPLKRMTLQGGPQGFSQINAEALRQDAGASGDSGNIVIRAQKLVLENGGQVSTLSAGLGEAGSVDVYAKDVQIRGVQLPKTGDNPSGFFSTVPAGSGTPGTHGGNVTIIASGDVDLSQGGIISTTTSGVRDGGQITIEADEISMDGVAPGNRSKSSGVLSESVGGGGTQGGGGVVELVARRDIEIDDGARVATQTNSFGDAGQIELRAGRSIHIDDGAEISAISTGQLAQPGDAGTIALGAGDSIKLSRSTISSSASNSSGGQIDLVATDEISLRRSEVTSEVFASRPDSPGGGNVNIEVEEQLAMWKSEIATSVLAGESSGGDISIDPKVVILNESAIRAQADQGFGGNIGIQADNFFLSTTSLVSASSNSRLDGRIEIQSPNSTLTGELSALPENFLDISNLLTNPCAARTSRAGSFVVSTRGETPSSPDDLLSAGESQGGASGQWIECPRDRDS